MSKLLLWCDICDTVLNDIRMYLYMEHTRKERLKKTAEKSTVVYHFTS